MSGRCPGATRWRDWAPRFRPPALGNRTQQALRLAQKLPEHHAEGQAGLNRQIRIDRLPARRRSWRYRPQSERLFANPNRQITAPPQTFMYSAQFVTRCFCLAILSRRSALNLCGIYNFLKGTDRPGTRPRAIPATRPPQGGVKIGRRYPRLGGQFCMPNNNLGFPISDVRALLDLSNKAELDGMVAALP